MNDAPMSKDEAAAILAAELEKRGRHGVTSREQFGPEDDDWGLLACLLPAGHDEPCETQLMVPVPPDGPRPLTFSGLARPEHPQCANRVDEIARDALALLRAFDGPDPVAIATLLDNLACSQCTCAALALAAIHLGELAGLDMDAVIASWQRAAAAAAGGA
jgi:hypothetical protein